jgi:hypothetical protein
MQENRLIGSKLLSIESDILRKFHFDDIVDSFALKKAQKLL